MSETKFSPGNWSIENRMTAGEGWAVASDHDFPGKPRTTHRRYMAQIIGSVEDAHLVAASKELYEALEKILARFGSYERDCDCEDCTPIRVARAALAKARGETP